MQSPSHRVPVAFADQDNHAPLMANGASHHQPSMLFDTPIFHAHSGLEPDNIGLSAGCYYPSSQAAAEWTALNSDYGNLGPGAGYDTPNSLGAADTACRDSDCGKVIGPHAHFSLPSFQPAADGASPNSPASAGTPIHSPLFLRFYEMALQRLAERDQDDSSWLWDSLDENEQPGSGADKAKRPSVEDVVAPFLDALRSLPSDASTASQASRGWDMSEGPAPHTQHSPTELHHSSRMDTASSGFGSGVGEAHILTTGRKRKADQDANCNKEQDVERESADVPAGLALDDAAFMPAVNGNSTGAAHAMQNMQPGTMLTAAHVQMIADKLLATADNTIQPVKKRKTGLSSSLFRAMHRAKGAQRSLAAIMHPQAQLPSKPPLHARPSHPNPHQATASAPQFTRDTSMAEKSSVHRQTFAASNPQSVPQGSPGTPQHASAPAHVSPQTHPQGDAFHSAAAHVQGQLPAAPQAAPPPPAAAPAHMAGYQLGQVVWGKSGQWPWWPATVSVFA